MSKNINDLRDSMFEALQMLKDKTITIDEAKPVLPDGVVGITRHRIAG